MGQRSLDETKKLMGALLRMPPKPHSEMKLKDARTRKGRDAKGKASAASAKPKTA
jgi:hypothetical protein